MTDAQLIVLAISVIAGMCLVVFGMIMFVWWKASQAQELALNSFEEAVMGRKTPKVSGEKPVHSILQCGCAMPVGELCQHGNVRNPEVYIDNKRSEKPDMDVVRGKVKDLLIVYGSYVLQFKTNSVLTAGFKVAVDAIMQIIEEGADETTD